MIEGIKIGSTGPFTLTINFSLTKDGREDLNLLKKSDAQQKIQFENLHEAIEWANSIQWPEKPDKAKEGE